MSYDSQTRTWIWPEKALRQFIKVAVDRCFDRDGLNDDYRARIASNDAEITKVVKPNFAMTVLLGKISLTFNKIDITCQDQRKKTNYKEKFEKRMYGNLDLTLEVTTSLVNPMYAISGSHIDLTFVDTVLGFVGSGGSACSPTSVLPAPPYFPPIPPFGGLPDMINRNPKVHTERSEYILSTDPNDCIIASGIHQNIESQGLRALVVSNGMNSRITARGDGATVICSGTNGRIYSFGPDVVIQECGRNLSIQSMSVDASIYSVGAFTSICASGTNANIFFNGPHTQIKANGCAINDDLGKMLICRLKSAITESLNKDLPDYSVQGFTKNNWIIRNRCLQDNGHSTLMPLKALIQYDPFPDPQNCGRMLTIFISKYCVNAVAFSYHHDEILNCSLKQSDLVSQSTQSDSATSAHERSRCLAECFQDFSIKYPRASMEVNLGTIDAPTAKFADKHLYVTVLGSAIFRARLPDGFVLDVLKTEVTIQITVLPQVNARKLTGTLTSIVLKSYAIVESALGCVNRNVMQEVFDLVATQFLYRKMEEIIQKGIPLPLPLLSGIQDLQSVELSMHDDFLRIDADVTF